jgi:hypothetical protein
MHPSTSLANTSPNCFLSKSLNMNKVKLFCDASIMQQHSNLAAAFAVIEMKEAHPDALDKLLVVRSTIVMNDSYRQLHVGIKPQRWLLWEGRACVGAQHYKLWALIQGRDIVVNA